MSTKAQNKERTRNSSSPRPRKQSGECRAESPRQSVSPAKQAANRRNARKSTGPKTPEGKARSALNAIRHGLLAQAVVIPKDKTESTEEFQAMLSRLLDEIAPADLMETLLVERLAATYWRLRRLYRFEVGAIVDARETNDDASSADAQLPADNDFNRLIRYETAIDRTLHRLNTDLLKIRSARQADSRQSSSSPSPRRRRQPGECRAASPRRSSSSALRTIEEKRRFLIRAFEEAQVPLPEPLASMAAADDFSSDFEAAAPMSATPQCAASPTQDFPVSLSPTQFSSSPRPPVAASAVFPSPQSPAPSSFFQTNPPPDPGIHLPSSSLAASDKLSSDIPFPSPPPPVALPPTQPSSPPPPVSPSPTLLSSPFLPVSPSPTQPSSSSPSPRLRVAASPRQGSSSSSSPRQPSSPPSNPAPTVGPVTYVTCRPIWNPRPQPQNADFCTNEATARPPHSSPFVHHASGLVRTRGPLVNKKTLTSATHGSGARARARARLRLGLGLRSGL